MLTDVLYCILIDLCQPIFYLFVIAAGCLLSVGVLLGFMKVTGRGVRLRILPERLHRILLVVYLLVLLQTALFSREPGSRHSIDLTLFETWGRSAVSHAYFIENILMYVPFGFLMPLCFRRMERFWICVLTALVSSVLLELTQLLTQRGYCQLDDVVTNTVGALVGWLFWCLICRRV